MLVCVTDYADTDENDGGGDVTIYLLDYYYY